MTIRKSVRILAGFAASLAGLLPAQTALAQSATGLDARAAAVIEHWTPERRAAAIPRDLLIDERGLGYLRLPNGNLQPYGHDIVAQADTAGPLFGTMTPASGSTVASGTVTFTANVTDASGVKSVSMTIQKSGGLAQSFNMNKGSGDAWTITLNGVTDGSWTWKAVAKDGAKPPNSTTSSTISFTAGSGGPPPPPPPPGTVSSSPWTTGVAKMAIGRIYFEMPSNPKATRWTAYVCSGTVVNDDPGNSGTVAADRSLILTASHCVYDDEHKAFARNVLFIPDQMDTTGTGTDTNCNNDPKGCWSPAFGVVDVNWTTRVFPDNVAWDYAFYVVPNTGAHSGTTVTNAALDQNMTPMNISFGSVNIGSLGTALGYSYSEDPKLMYCADTLANETTSNGADYWLAGCGLTGGSSGGPWSQTFDTGTGDGPIISVNSWGYTNQPGMAGPKLVGTSASCVFGAAQTNGLAAGNVAKTCP